MSQVLIVEFSFVTCIHQTEVIKGPCGSVGMTFRHVPASEGDAVHVSIETVTPNSPAALADLQKGDRLIAIGGLRCATVPFSLFLKVSFIFLQFFLSENIFPVVVSVNRCKSDILSSSAQTVEASWRQGGGIL